MNRTQILPIFAFFIVSSAAVTVADPPSDASPISDSVWEPNSGPVDVTPSLPRLELARGEPLRTLTFAPESLTVLTQAENASGAEPTQSAIVYSGLPRADSVVLRGSLGFTLDPTTFLMGFETNYFLNNDFALGPLLQIGVTDERSIVAPTLNTRWVFDLPWEEVDRLKPFVQGGLGFVYMHKDNRNGENDDVGFLLNLGFGADVYLTDQFALGSNLLFNIMPDKVLGNNFYFSWQFVTASFHF